MNVAPYHPMVIRNPETGMQTEQQRIAEQDLANQMQMGTSNNPDDIRTSIAKAKSMADYRAKIESDKAQNKIATQGAYTNSVNQDNAQRSAYEQRAEQIDYSNKSADEQANMQYNLLEQRRQGQLAADMLAGVGSVKSAERNMDYQVAHATYQTGMRDADTKAILARNVLSNATYDLNAVSDNKSSAAYAKAYAVYIDADTKNTIAQKEFADKDKELRATFMGVQRGLTLKQALPGSVGSLTFKAGGTIEKAQIKATADIEKAELKKATDDNKLAERRAIVAYKVFKDATDLVKKSNEVLVKAYFRR
jgi:hypothetical protein